MCPFKDRASVTNTHSPFRSDPILTGACERSLQVKGHRRHLLVGKCCSSKWNMDELGVGRAWTLTLKLPKVKAKGDLIIKPPSILWNPVYCPSLLCYWYQLTSTLRLLSNYIPLLYSTAGVNYPQP